MPVGISNAKITVFDTNNRLVHTGEFKFDEVYTFGEKLEAGVYIVRVTQEGKLGSVRLVKY